MSPHRSDEPQRPPPSVLIVDDDPEIREVVALTLMEQGYHVREAGDGCEALAALRGAGPADLILLDMWMPGMNGEALCAELRRDAELAAIPIVICTASGDGALLCARLAAAAWVPKPFDVRHLVATVDGLCRPGPEGAPAAAARIPSAGADL